MKWIVPLLLLAVASGCSSSDMQEIRAFDGGEKDARGARSDFLSHFEKLRTIKPESKEDLKAIHDLAAQMEEAQGRRYRAIENLKASVPALRQARRELLKAELNIYNGVVAFKAGVQTSEINRRKYRVYLSGLEETTMGSEEFFLSYERQMKELLDR